MIVAMVAAIFTTLLLNLTRRRTMSDSIMTMRVNTQCAVVLQLSSSSTGQAVTITVLI